MTRMHFLSANVAEPVLLLLVCKSSETPETLAGSLLTRLWLLTPDHTPEQYMTLESWEYNA